MDSVFIIFTNNYPQVFLEECKDVVKEKGIPKYIIDGKEIFLLILIEKILMKKTFINNFLMKKIPMKKYLMKNIKKILT